MTPGGQALVDDREAARFALVVDGRQSHPEDVALVPAGGRATFGLGPPALPVDGGGPGA